MPPFPNLTSPFYLLFLACIPSTLVQHQCHDVHHISILPVGCYFLSVCLSNICPLLKWCGYIVWFPLLLESIQHFEFSAFFGDGCNNFLSWLQGLHTAYVAAWLYLLSPPSWIDEPILILQWQVGGKETALISCRLGQKWCVPWSNSGDGRSKNKWMRPSHWTVVCDGFFHLPFILLLTTCIF